MTPEATMNENLSKFEKSQIYLATFLVVALMVWLPLAAQAGAGGTEFSPIYDQMVDWVQGIFGRLIVLAMIVVGIIAGVVRQSLMAFAVGIGGGIGLYNIPSIVNAIVSATI
jgi:conjugal transfer pilus assembly protein TraA